ncbi:hypothetical protein [Enterovibrio nigricans]|uniref:Uncharacterized protein n=1 Tax=Enterovibrio nigricans DSM 22720 TaxID=1121868 RepID=A0A1T4UTQ2_9GAMM|nr:hypothetical protein [Enterovibrio nigricans]PKF50956.1 hypothetical protein AT251_07570 [Enterovibrio nigricans]SKA56063.1 hypothetical protein SAMN02745132_02505 [Enterovibrio nigricans DSM 22720]
MKKMRDARSGDIRLRLGGGTGLKVFGLLLLATSVFLAVLGSVNSGEKIFYWSVCTAFGWHMTFLNHQIVINPNTRQFARKISSLYSIYRFEANLDAIRGFAVSRALISRDRYGRKVFELAVLFASGKREKLLAGSKDTLIQNGQDIATLCDKPFYVDAA